MKYKQVAVVGADHHACFDQPFRCSESGRGLSAIPCKYHLTLRHVSLQPWAQLLVLGIKRIEGRGWSSMYRGRLWIHATAQHPNSSTVKASPCGSNHA